MSTAVRRGIFQKLSAAPSVTSKLSSPDAIFEKRASSDAEYPFVIFQKMTGTRTRAFGRNAFRRETWLVKAVDRNTTSDRVESIAEAIDAILDLGTITVSGQTLCDFHHVSDVDYLEPAGDQQYRHSGAIYAVVTTS